MLAFSVACGRGGTLALQHSFFHHHSRHRMADVSGAFACMHFHRSARWSSLSMCPLQMHLSQRTNSVGSVLVFLGGDLFVYILRGGDVCDRGGSVDGWPRVVAPFSCLVVSLSDER